MGHPGCLGLLTVCDLRPGWERKLSGLIDPVLGVCSVALVVSNSL